jgi:hypothetical protein
MNEQKEYQLSPAEAIPQVLCRPSSPPALSDYCNDRNKQQWPKTGMTISWSSRLAPVGF